jgi:tellurite resistance protein TehA-like permease
VNAVARWALVPHYIETINPNWMIPVVGNLVAALVAPRLDDGYDEVRTFLLVSIRL